MKKAEGGDVPLRGAGGKNRQSAGFSRGRLGASLWERRREEEQARETALTNITLFLGRGSATGWERRRARRIDASFCLNYRRRSYDFLRSPPTPSPIRYFPSFSKTFSRPLVQPPFSNNVKCIVCLRSYLQRRRASSYFMEHPLQGHALATL